MATKAVMCMIQMPADAPEKDVKIYMYLRPTTYKKQLASSI